MPWLWPASLLAALALWRLLRGRCRFRLAEGDAVLVTGCDSGFGVHIVRALLEHSSAAVFAGFVTEPGRARLAALGARVTALPLDVTRDKEVEAAFEALAASGKRLRGVVNNAGVGCYGWCEAIPLEHYERYLQVNLLGAIRVTRLALPLLRRSRGRLVTMGSLGARVPSAFGSAYLPTKAALASFQDCVRQEVHRFGVRCSLVEPGFFATGMLHRAVANGERATSRPSPTLGAGGGGASSGEGDLADVYGSWAQEMKRLEGSVRLCERINGGERGAAKVADAVLDGLTATFPMTRYLVGLDANVLGRVGPLIPDWVVDLVRTYIV